MTQYISEKEKKEEQKKGGISAESMGLVMNLGSPMGHRLQESRIHRKSQHIDTTGFLGVGINCV
jgi:hypothetical protein